MHYQLKLTLKHLRLHILLLHNLYKYQMHDKNSLTLFIQMSNSMTLTNSFITSLHVKTGKKIMFTTTFLPSVESF